MARARTGRVNREQLEHVIRAAASISGDDDLVIVGSQAILGQFPEAPAELLRSVEVDLYPLHDPERADVVEGGIGELSPFHETFGYYAQAVGPTTAILPEGWRDRLVPVRSEKTRGATGWCLEVHDLVLSKCAACRDKDREYLRVALAHGLVTRELLSSRLATMPLDAPVRAQIATWIAA